MTPRRIEPRFPGLLANTLPSEPMSRLYMTKFQTFTQKLIDQILVYQFLLLKWTKKFKTNVNYGTPPPQITIIE